MPSPQYRWRQLTPDQREKLLLRRRGLGQPWHSPPHQPNFGKHRFHITAACYDHLPHIGYSPERMDDFACRLLEVFKSHATKTYAWCVLPNHYHALVAAPDVLELLSELGKLHGRSSHQWNGEENWRGRKVFFRAMERGIRSNNHFWATMNYVHHNPVRHGYVANWTDWPWSSAREYLQQSGRATAERIWKDYPLADYGTGWDDPEL